MRLTRLLICALTVGAMLCACGDGQAESGQNPEVRKYLRKGNKLFRLGQREEANTYYRKAFDVDTADAQTLYNLATSSMEEQYWRPWQRTADTLMVKALGALDTTFQAAAYGEKNPLRKSMSYYNEGVLLQSVFQSKQKQEYLQQAIEAYKNALRNNPQDTAARYNLVVCQKQLKNSPQQSSQDNQNQQSQDDQQNQQEQQKDSTQQQQQQPQQQPQQQQPQQQSMDEQNIEQLLNAAMQKEKDTQKKMNEAQQKGTCRLNEKNW